MNQNINKSINFLLAEYQRLKAKEKNNTITKEEQITLQKLTMFLGKKNDT